MTIRVTAVVGSIEDKRERNRTPAQSRKFYAKQRAIALKEEAKRRTEKLLDMIGMGAKKILKVRNYTNYGYMVVTYLMDKSYHGAKNDWEHSVAFSTDGVYLGTKKDAHQICVKRGIIPMKKDFMRYNASIGFCPKDGKWYGWSHRAIYGFKPGQVVKAGHIAGPKKGSRKLKTHAECKAQAIAFANDVS